jgi:hypothetical protein
VRHRIAAQLDLADPLGWELGRVEAALPSRGLGVGFSAIKRARFSIVDSGGPLPGKEMKMQFRAEFYNVFNHSNLHVNGGTNDLNAASFNHYHGQAVPGVTASFRDNRQIALALKLIY